MQLKIQTDPKKTNTRKNLEKNRFNDQIYSKDYVDFLNEAGWKLEKKLPSNTNSYSDLLEDTDWKSATNEQIIATKHYRRDLDALS